MFAAFSEKLFPRERIRHWFIERVRTRRGPITPPFELEYRHIFVLPSAFGCAFGLMLMFMALGGLNFNNNMALLLVFLLAAIAQLTTVLSYRNLVGLRIGSVRAEPVFDGEPAHFRIHISNPEERSRLAIQAGIRETQDCADLAMQSTGSLVLKQETQGRGWLKMDAFRIETRYPLGMFKAWAWIFPNARCLVYPAPSRKAPPLPRTGSGPAGRARLGEGEQVHGLRLYRLGDSPKRVAWRTSARHDELYTREMEKPRDEACKLSWDALPGTHTESRLSILTAWVLLADHRQIPYSLDMPAGSIDSSLGVDHRNRCLELLALHNS